MIASIELSTLQWSLILLCGLIIGMSKTGVPGIAIVVIPILAYIFGGKSSTGILLPILIMADVFGVSYYHRHAKWVHLLKAFPWAFVGVLIAMLVGKMINDDQFKKLIAIVIFISIALMIIRDRRKSEDNVPNKWWFAALLGLGGGFATMIGNAAGPIFAIYLLALKLPKNTFIGTAAWFFFVINLSKFPLHVFSWKTISWESLTIDLVALPAIALGAFIGIKVVRVINNDIYRWLVIVTTTLSAFLMFI